MNIFRSLMKSTCLRGYVRLGCFLLLFGNVLMLSAERAETWWALQPLKRPAIPQEASKFPGWASNPIDRFIALKYLQHGFAPSLPADRVSLIRRASFDLTGLPPSPGEVDAFVNDDSPVAYANLIERLLGSPHCGERWARHWMDVVHYAETHGHDEDAIRENAWPYRDYLIESFNSDKPYAQFVREQVAGDVLFPDQPSVVRAIGMLATGPWDESSQMGISDGTIDKKIAQYLDRDDMIATVMSTFVSTTVHCARCHDHKFDPVSTEDYYSLQAVFSGVDKVDRPYDPNGQVAKLRRRLLKVKAQLDRGELPHPLPDHSLSAHREEQLRLGQGGWVVLYGAKVQSTDGVTFEAKPDGSFLAQGQAPERDTATFTAVLPMDGVTAVQLDVLADESLPKGGPGRAPNGNLHLSEIVVKVSGRPVKISQAKADFNQASWVVGHAIDGDLKTAWGIHPEESKPHRAMFVFEKPLTALKGETMEIELRQLHGGSHLIGRPRLSVTNAAKPALIEILPQDVGQALAIEPAKRTNEQIKVLTLYFSREANAKEVAALGERPKVYAVASDFSALGNFKPAGKPREVHVLQRGSIHSPGEKAVPGALGCVDALKSRFAITSPDDEGQRRAALANWLADERNVLTWRSIVNRVWHYHFGRGLVGTPNDFGRMGDRPSHPELLDWLAFEFRGGGGSLKWLHRTIMTSSVYQQNSAHNEEYTRRDADNRWLWRVNRTRLDAESYRDSLLQLAGNADLKMGGPSARHFNMSKGVHVTPNLDYVGFDPDSPANFRRSVYRFVFRTVPDPLMQLMDCPDASQHAPKRESSVTALQALAMLNNRFLVRQSERLAKRLRHESSSLSTQVRELFELAYHREPEPEEGRLVLALAREHGLANACRVILNSSEFVFLN